jgi:acetolactate decarboxylase
LRFTIRAAAIAVALTFLCAVAGAQPAGELYQVSTINALLQGVYDGVETFGELKQHGDFGIGTLDALDGEMVGLDGRFYQVKSNGQVSLLNDAARTPFAAVTFFRPDRVEEIGAVQDYAGLQKALAGMIGNENYFYAIRIDGEFAYVKTRSVPAQSKPYRPLAEVTKTQSVFEMKNIKGTIVGFWCPQFVSGVNVPGYHLHFIATDRQQGGHILALALQSGTVKIARITRFVMALPVTDEFRQAALGQDYQEQLKAAEE